MVFLRVSPSQQVDAEHSVRVFELVAVPCVLLAFLCVSLVMWGSLTPTVVLHYAHDAAAPVVVYFNDNHRLTRETIHPGESVRFSTTMFASPESWIEVSTPFVNRRSVEITGKFSRVDVCISAQARFSSHIRHQYFSRFTSSSEPCGVADHGR